MGVGYCTQNYVQCSDNRWSRAGQRTSSSYVLSRRGPDVLSDEVIVGRCWAMYRCWLQQLAAIAHRTRCRIVTERHQRRRKPRDPLCRRVDTMRAGRCGARGRGDVTRDHAGHLAERPVRPRPASRYKTDRLRRGAWVNCSTAVGTRRRSTAIMKSLSVLVILGVLVASTYASYVGPYRHYYVPGFQHTCVANDVQFMKNIGKHEHIKITVLNGRGQIAKSDQN